MRPRKRYAIGIDPGTETGIAVYDRQTGQIVLAQTVDFWTLFLEVLKDYPPDQTDVIVEDARLNKPTFAKEGDWHMNPDRFIRKREKISRNVGGVQIESRLIIQGLKARGYAVKPIRPSGEKWDARTCQRITGYTGRTSSHARDAIRFCYNVNFILTESDV